jgi:hypothetical protein
MAINLRDRSVVQAASLVDRWFSEYEFIAKGPPNTHNRDALVEWRGKAIDIWRGFRNICRCLAKWIDDRDDLAMDSEPLWLLSGCDFFSTSRTGDVWNKAWVLCQRLRSKVGTSKQAATAHVIAKRIDAAARRGAEKPADSEQKKGVAVRRDKFLEWYNAEGTDTYHKPAKICNTWNGLTQKERAAICPESPNKVAKSTVATDIKRARKNARPHNN